MITPLEKQIGYHFKNRDLLAAALTHPSYRHEQDQPGADNQRLEFLGDAALGLVAAAALYRRHPDAAEGQLTTARSQLTNRKALAAIGKALDLGQWLRLGRGEEQSAGRTRPSSIADALEALFGAIFLEGGMCAVEAAFEHLWQSHLVQTRPAPEYNPKGELQIYCQKRWKCSPVYQVLSESGPVHAPRYTCQVVINGQPYAEGEGPSKRAAEAAAAQLALTKLQTN